MAEEEVWENERDLGRLDIHGGGDEEGLDNEEDTDDEENYHFGKEDYEYDVSDFGTYYSDDDEPRPEISRPFDYNILPAEIWTKIFRMSGRRETRKIAMICPHFYKIVGADFKRLCIEFDIFKLVGETYLCAFDSFLWRRGSITDMACDYKVGLYWPERQAITVVSLDLDDTNITTIRVKDEILEGEEAWLYYGGTRLRYLSKTGVYYHDVQTGALLAYIPSAGRHFWFANHYTVYRMGDTAFLFSGISLEFRQVAIPEWARLLTARHNDQHEYCVFETLEKIIVYDSRTDRRLEIAVSYKSMDFHETKIMPASNSLIDGGERSFRIYNIQTGGLLFEYHGKPRRRDADEDTELFLVINDFIVAERGKKQIFYYDQDDQTWKSSKAASPKVQQQLYRAVFGSSLSASLIWRYRVDFRPFDARAGVSALKDVIKERLEGVPE